MDWHAESEAWLKKKQLWPREGEHPDWGIVVKMSTQPVWDWTVHGSRIRPDDVWLGLTVHRLLGWMITVYTRDKRYLVQWRPSGVTVDSQQLRYRRMTAWPALSDLDNFPALIPALESLLAIRFQPRATVEVPTLTAEQIERLRLWLTPACTEVELQVLRLDGPLPPSLAKYALPEKSNPPFYRFILPAGTSGPQVTSDS